MANNTRLEITELDFDTIKTNLKEFLQGQSEFSDYDFEGSGLSIMLDILAYNTHYSAFMANMLGNEMYLDTAVKRDSAVSRARELGYTTTSRTAPTAVITLTIVPNDEPSTITVPKNTKFTTVINNTTYTFVTTVAHAITGVDGVFTKSGIEIKEGKYATFSYIIDTSDTRQEFLIPNMGIDTTAMNVTVRESVSSSSTTTWTLATDIIEITDQSKVYWLEEVEDEKYRLKFGDGVVGKSLTNGNVLTIEYLLTGGVEANGASTFSLNSIAGYDDVTITVEDVAAGGASIEDIDSIKFLAPRAYETQNRGLTDTDFENILKKNYRNIDSIKVWGGEDNNPPVFGKVFIALKPKIGSFLSENAKNRIKDNILKKRKVATITPEFVDPNYLYIGVETKIYYNSNNTGLSSDEITSNIQTAIRNFFTVELGKFDKKFRYSKMSKVIDNSGSGYINNNLTTITIQKRLEPTLNINERHNFDYHVAIKPYTVSSTTFNVGSNLTKVKIDDVSDTTPANWEGTGTLRLINFETDIIENANIGTIDYATGEIDIKNLTITGLPSDGQLLINGTPQTDDIPSVRSTILLLDDSVKNNTINRKLGLKVTTIPEVE